MATALATAKEWELQKCNFASNFPHYIDAFASVAVFTLCPSALWSICTAFQLSLLAYIYVYSAKYSVYKCIMRNVSYLPLAHPPTPLSLSRSLLKHLDFVSYIL